MQKKKTGAAIILSMLLLSGTFSYLKAQAGEHVEVTIKILRQNGNPAQIPFDPGTPLEIADFKGRTDPSSHGVAATRSGIEMNMSGRKQNNRVAIEVELFVYFDKSKSWIKKEGRNSRILNHEQHHLDITALQLCRLIKAIKAYPFSVDAWDTELKKLYKKNMQELQERQNRYDRQTRHGTDPDAQSRYDRNIIMELRKQDCFRK